MSALIVAPKFAVTIDVRDGVTYHYLGLSTAAIVDYIEPDIQLDRSAQSDGARTFESHTDTEGEYPGFDRFGRTRKQLWIDGAFTTSVTQGQPNVPPIVELDYTYDQASNRLSRYDATATLAWPHRHHEYHYDGLHRLEKAAVGERTSGNIGDPTGFTYHDRSEQWTLDMLGNWDTFEFAPDSGGSNWDSEDRDHNEANELIERDGTLDLTYDRNGNLLTQQIVVGNPPFLSQQTITYTWDAWNRLVKVKYGINDRAAYRYNGLNWRIRKDADTSMPPDGTLNQRRRMYYSAGSSGGWQLVEEDINDDVFYIGQGGPVRQMQYVWGPRYIDDIVLRRQSSDLENDDPDVTYEDVWYHCTDALFSTVAIVDESAVLVERVSYDAYGRARHHRRADLDGDGATTLLGDGGVIGNNLGNYGEGDLNRDGVVNSSDSTIVDNDQGAALSSGQLSSTDNVIGYAGYVFNAEMHGGGLYTVRHRHYSPDLGRWMSRDPLGYVDGMGLYEYVRGNSVQYVDRNGWEATEPDSKPAYDPRNDPTQGCGITIHGENADWPERWGHEWIEINDPDVSPGVQNPRKLGYWPDPESWLGPIGGRGLWYSPLGNPDDSTWKCRITCENDAKDSGDYSWPTTIIDNSTGTPEREPGILYPDRDFYQYRHFLNPTLRFGIGKGRRSDEATCDEIRNCLDRFVPSQRYQFPFYQCQSAVAEALEACGLRKVIE